MSTSSFSSIKLGQPSPGTKAAIFFPFLMSCTRTHLRMAELGCLASMPMRSTTIPLACDAAPIGLLRGEQVGLVVLLVGPSVGLAVLLELASRAKSVRFSATHLQSTNQPPC